MQSQVASPLVSILIPVYNRAGIVLDSLKSAVNQTYKDIEVVVVDNHSTDNTYEVIQKFAQSHQNVRPYQNNSNLGAVRNWIKCVEYSKAEYVQILYSDDMLSIDSIEKKVPWLMEHKDVGFVLTGTEVFDAETTEKIHHLIVGNTGIYDTKKFIDGSLLRAPFPKSPGCVMYRRKDLLKNILTDIPNKFNIDFNIKGAGVDKLISMLTATSYSKFAYIAERLSLFRRHKDSITISSDSTDLSLLYNMAYAYYVEEHLSDERVAKEFNMCLDEFLRKRGRQNSYGISSVRDFYLKLSKSANRRLLWSLFIKHLIPSYLREKRYLPKKCFNLTNYAGQVVK